MEPPKTFVFLVLILLISLCVLLAGCRNEKPGFQEFFASLKASEFMSGYTGYELIPARGMYEFWFPDSSRLAVSYRGGDRWKIRRMESTDNTGYGRWRRITENDSVLTGKVLTDRERLRILAFISMGPDVKFWFDPRQIQEGGLPQYHRRKEMGGEPTDLWVSVLYHAGHPAGFEASNEFAFAHPVRLEDGWYYWELPVVPENLPEVLR